MIAITSEQRIFHSWLERGYPYLVLCFLPIALLDLRVDPIIVKIRISDIYLVGLVCLFPFANSGAGSWFAKCLLPFVPFLFYVLLSALLRNNTGGLYEMIQWVIVLLWVPLFASVFSRVELSQLKYFMFAMVIAAFYVVAVHLYEGIYTRYKYMGDAKYTFGFMFLLVSLWAFRRFTWPNLVLFSICAIVLGLSLERKGILISLLTILTVVPLVSLRVSVFLQSLALMFIQVFCLVSGFIAYQWLVKGNIAVTHYLDEGRALWESNLHRGNLLSNGMEIFQSNPWFGVGAKKLDDHMQEYYLSEKLAHYTHNWYLDFFIEYGIVGVVCFFVPVIWIMLKIRPNHERAWLYIPLAAYCLSVPALMANGTTTMLIYFTAIASIFVLGIRSESREFLS